MGSQLTDRAMSSCNVVAHPERRAWRRAGPIRREPARTWAPRSGYATDVAVTPISPRRAVRSQRRGHRHPVDGAGHPRRVGLQVHPHAALVQTPPAAPSPTSVIARGAPLAAPAAALSRPGRAHPRHQHLLGADPLQCHSFDDRVLYAQHRCPYPGSAHAVPRMTVLGLSTNQDFRQTRNLRRVPIHDHTGALQPNRGPEAPRGNRAGPSLPATTGRRGRRDIPGPGWRVAPSRSVTEGALDLGGAAPHPRAAPRDRPAETAGEPFFRRRKQLRSARPIICVMSLCVPFMAQRVNPTIGTGPGAGMAFAFVTAPAAQL